MKLKERTGFEPARPCGRPVFKTGAIDHSATSPGLGIRRSADSSITHRCSGVKNSDRQTAPQVCTRSMNLRIECACTRLASDRVPFNRILALDDFWRAYYHGASAVACHAQLYRLSAKRSSTPNPSPSEERAPRRGPRLKCAQSGGRGNAAEAHLQRPVRKGETNHA